MTYRLLPLALVSLALAACQPADPPSSAPASGSEAPAMQASAGARSVSESAADANHAFGPEISAEDLAAHIRVMSADAFEGRAPGGRGEELTVSYIRSQFQRLGLQPGNGDSYFQTVSMVETTPDSSVTLQIDFPDGSETLSFGKQMVVGTSTGREEVAIADSEIVFLGYGIRAPEADWNDYSIDVKDKTLVVLVNDPGFASGDPEVFQGKRMTYYGRWSYKFEEAARQGAAAVLIVHEDAAAGYGWDVVENSWGGAQFDLTTSLDPAPRLPAQGWISGDSAEMLFKRSGHDLGALRQAAGQRGFAPVPLNARLTTTLRSEVRDGESRNVMALLPGSERPEEVIVYMGHWDHLGMNPELEGDQIYNGAVDNATGIAGILEIAERFVTEKPPQRSILFMAVTLEESGLLGSKYYTANPVHPLANTVAAINMDALYPIGRTRDFVVTGMGNSELEDVLRPIAGRQGRTLVPESAPEKGFYYRSDHFNFAKAGVPALYAKGGIDHVEKGEAYGRAWAAEYSANRYHKPADEFDPSWDLSGLVEDLNALYAVGRQLADSDQWPNWYEGNEFRAVRDVARPPASP
jgi:Zn-dependent M28 family amino/carboxypeptidase